MLFQAYRGIRLLPTLRRAAPRGAPSGKPSSELGSSGLNERLIQYGRHFVVALSVGVVALIWAGTIYFTNASYQQARAGAMQNA
jgi:hypothetical protein